MAVCVSVVYPHDHVRTGGCGSLPLPSLMRGHHTTYQQPGEDQNSRISTECLSISHPNNIKKSYVDPFQVRYHRSNHLHIALSVGILQVRILNGLPCPPPGDLPNPGIEPRSPALQADSLPAELPGGPYILQAPQKIIQFLPLHS